MDIKKVAPDANVAGKPCFTRRGLATALCKAEQTIAGWATRGFGPPYLLIGRQAFYPVQEVLEWLETTLVTPEGSSPKNWKKIQR